MLSKRSPARTASPAVTRVLANKPATASAGNGLSKATTTSRGPEGHTATGCAASLSIWRKRNSLPLPAGPVPQSGGPECVATSRSPFGLTQQSTVNTFRQAKIWLPATKPAPVFASVVR